MTLDQLLARVEAIAAKATKEPWVSYGPNYVFQQSTEYDPWAVLVCETTRGKDANFIVMSRSLLLPLVAVARATSAYVAYFAAIRDGSASNMRIHSDKYLEMEAALAALAEVGIET